MWAVFYGTVSHRLFCVYISLDPMLSLVYRNVDSIPLIADKMYHKQAGLKDPKKSSLPVSAFS